MNLKNWMIVGALAAVSLGACTKATYSKKTINGVWFVDSIAYNGSLNVPFGLGGKFTGEAKQRGYIAFIRETAEVFYDITFETDSLRVGNFAIGPLEVRMKESGTFTETDSLIHVIPGEGGAEFDIMKTNQILTEASWNTKAVTKTKVSVPFLGAIEVPANFDLVMKAKKAKP
ncbi:MAG: hypothetical protein ACOVOL_04280 [Bacteroidia bacterium]